METWQVLASVAVLLVGYAVVVEFAGSPVTLVGVVFAIVFGLIGVAIGRRFSRGRFEE